MENWGNKMIDIDTKKRIKDIENALVKYGQHSFDCELCHVNSEINKKCTCGFSHFLRNMKYYIGKTIYFWEAPDERHEMEIVSLDGNTGIAKSLRDGNRYNFIINNKEIIVLEN